MDLWIRSQDRRILQKVDNIFLNANYENKRISSLVDDYEVKLATYETKERALEVLDEIDEFIDLFQRNGFGNVLSDDGVHPKHTIYKMPEN